MKVYQNATGYINSWQQWCLWLQIIETKISPGSLFIYEPESPGRQTLGITCSRVILCFLVTNSLGSVFFLYQLPYGRIWHCWLYLTLLISLLFLQSSKKKIPISVGEGEGGMIWENSIETCMYFMYFICEIDHQSRFDAWDRVLRAGALGWPWGVGWGGRWEGGSGWGTRVYPWLIHLTVWQKPPQYCKVISLQLK